MESDQISSEQYQHIMDCLTISDIHELASDPGIINLSFKFRKKYRAHTEDELQNPPNRSPHSSPIFNSGEEGFKRIEGSSCLGRYRGLGVTGKEFHENNIYGKNLNTLIYGALSRGQPIPENALLMYSRTASVSDLILLDLAVTLMARSKENPFFCLESDYYRDEKQGKGVSVTTLKLRDLDVCEVFETHSDYRNEAWNQALTPSSASGQIHLDEDLRSFSVQSYLDIMDLVTPEDYRQLWHHRMDMSFTKGPGCLTDQKVQWKILLNQSLGLTESTRNEALRALLTFKSMNDGVFISRDQQQAWYPATGGEWPVDSSLDTGGDVTDFWNGTTNNGHWALMQIFRSLHISAIPRARRILGLPALPNFTADPHYRETRTVIPTYWERLIPTMGYNSSTLYHPDSAEVPLDAGLEYAVSDFLGRLAGSQNNSLEKAYTLTSPTKEGVRVFPVWADFDDLTSLQITAEMLQMLQDLSNSVELYFF